VTGSCHNTAWARAVLDAVGYVRERDDLVDDPGVRFKAWGFSVAACEVCAPLAGRGLRRLARGHDGPADL
jgi:hypothetical protein